MSNYYTQFCSPIRASGEDADWCNKYMGILSDFEGARGPEDLDEDYSKEDFEEYQRLCSLYELDLDCTFYPEFEWEYDEDNGLFILSAADHGKPEHAAIFFQEYLKARHPDRCHYFTWANTSSDLEPEAFSGGAVFITAESIEWNVAYAWGEEKTKEFEAKND